MITDLTWNEFCERYYETARQTARHYLNRQKNKSGGFHRLVDEDYVLDSAVLTGLEKTYQYFNASRGVKLTTFLSRIIHNEIVDELTRESKEAERKDDLDALRTAVQSFGESPSEEKREQLLSRMTAAIRQLSPSDQVILNYYLEDQSSYIENSVKELAVTPNYVSVRRIRIFALLPKLMDLSPEQYTALRYADDNILIANKNVVFGRTSAPVPVDFNPINKDVNPAWMAMRLYSLLD